MRTGRRQPPEKWAQTRTQSQGPKGAASSLSPVHARASAGGRLPPSLRPVPRPPTDSSEPFLPRSGGGRRGEGGGGVLGLFLPLRGGVSSGGWAAWPRAPHRSPGPRTLPAYFCVSANGLRDYLVKLFNNSYIIRIWIPINFPGASNHSQLTLVINAIHH